MIKIENDDDDEEHDDETGDEEEADWTLVGRLLVCLLTSMQNEEHEPAETSAEDLQSSHRKVTSWLLYKRTDCRSKREDFKR